MKKRKYPKIYKNSDVSLKQIGKFEERDRALPYGTPLYAVVNPQGEVIYPRFFKHLNRGDPKDTCEGWIRNECWNPEDKPFRKSLLEKMMRMENGEKIRDMAIIDNESTYHGNEHTSFTLVFKQGEEYYRFGYVDRFGLSLGTWMGPGLQINSREYLCKRVYPKERTIKVVDFVIG